MGQPGWFPDWFGNNGRTIISPLFQTNCVLNTTNYGCYSSKQLDSLITQAEAATSISQAGTLWHKADSNVMTNAVIVPLLSQQLLMYSQRERGAGGHLRDRLPAEHRRARHHQRLAEERLGGALSELAMVRPGMQGSVPGRIRWLVSGYRVPCLTISTIADIQPGRIERSPDVRNNCNRLASSASPRRCSALALAAAL